MKKILNKVCMLLFFAALAMGFAACNAELEAPETSENWTIKELGANIEAAGDFWNAWWASHSTFERGHIDDSRRNWNPWDETITPAHHPLSRGFAIVLPSSGFASLGDIGVYLSQFYTQTWVDRGLFTEPEVFMDVHGTEYTIFGYAGFAGFEEYEGELFIFAQPEMSARPNWQTATHILLEQDGNRAVVQTIVTTSIYGFDGGGTMPTITYRFTLIDGKIDSGYGRWQHAETPLGPQNPHVSQGFYTPIGDNMLLFAYRPHDIALTNFDTLVYIPHPVLAGVDVIDEDVLIGATHTIYNVSLIVIENIWDAAANQDRFTVAESYLITETLQAGEAIIVNGYVGVGSMPWSGITFTTAPGERHFFAISHDSSDSPNWFVLLDITGQMLAG